MLTTRELIEMGREILDSDVSWNLTPWERRLLSTIVAAAARQGLAALEVRRLREIVDRATSPREWN